MTLHLITRGTENTRGRETWNICPAPAIVTDSRKVANFRKGGTDARNNVWKKKDKDDPTEGWLLIRRAGLDIDYGHIILRIDLFDDSFAGFYRRTDPQAQEPWLALKRAVWWSMSVPPVWLLEAGTRMPNDDECLSIIDDFCFDM